MRHIPPCHSTRQTGCVVAYSSFAHAPPPNSAFGRTTSDLGLRLLAPTAPRRGVHVLCVNPASPAGGSALLEPMLPTLALGFLGSPAPSVTTPWVAFPGEYTARCRTKGDATWLQISPAGGRDRRPDLTAIRDAAFGLHVLDVNIALGNLVRLVQDQVAAYRHR